jgi:hypothetical protein
MLLRLALRRIFELVCLNQMSSNGSSRRDDELLSLYRLA